MFNMVYLPRTISNSMEAALAAVALYYWPIHVGHGRPFDCKRFTLAITLVGLCCLVRLSAVTHWIFPAAYLMLCAPWLDKLRISGITAAVGIIIVTLGTLVDTYFYGSNKWVLTWWNFYVENVSKNGSRWFGVMPWHFYLSQGLPLMAFTMLPLIIVGIVCSGIGWPIGFLVSSVVINSMFDHKEFRFLLPLMPIVLALAGLGKHVIGHMHKTHKSQKRVYLAFILATNLIAGFYLIRWHQSGPLPALDWLRTEVDSNTRFNSAYFMMPCHSTPYYGYLHRNVPKNFLTCSMPVVNKSVQLTSDFKDEADIFYSDPVDFLTRHKEILSSNSHIFVFEALIEQHPKVLELLAKRGFKEHHRFFNSHWHHDDRRRGDIIAFVKS